METLSSSNPTSSTASSFGLSQPSALGREDIETVGVSWELEIPSSPTQPTSEGGSSLLVKVLAKMSASESPRIVMTGIVEVSPPCCCSSQAVGEGRSEVGGWSQRHSSEWETTPSGGEPSLQARKRERTQKVQKECELRCVCEETQGGNFRASERKYEKAQRMRGDISE